MAIDVAQVLVKTSVSLLVGGAGAWIAGLFGVRHGLNRAQRERAFERRLEWYEKTFRLIDKFRSASADFLLDFDTSQTDSGSFLPGSISSFETDEMKQEKQKQFALIKALENGVKALDECFEEALMFAERSIVIELSSFRKEVWDVQIAARYAQISFGDEKARLIEKLWKVHATMDSLIGNIGGSVRGQLGLDPITPNDLKSTRGEGRKERITE